MTATPNVITTSLSYLKQDAMEYFFTPMFLGDDIRQDVYVDTDVKYQKALNYFNMNMKLTKAGGPGTNGTNWTTPKGAIYSQKTLTVVPVKAQWMQDAQEFYKTVYNEMMNRGTEISNMTGTEFGQIILQGFQTNVKRDLNNDMWFGDVTKEIYSAGIRTGNVTTTYDANNIPTAGPDVYYNIYDGFWTRIIRDIKAVVIPAKQYVKINSSTTAVAQLATETLTGTTAGSITLTISGVAYTQAYATSITATVTAWFTANAATLLTRGITVTNPSAGVLSFAAVNPGEGYTIGLTSAGTGGTWTESAVTANVQAGSLATDEAFSTLKKMWTGLTPELRQYISNYSGLNQAYDVAHTQILGSIKIYCTSTFIDNYKSTLENQANTTGQYLLMNGIPVPTYRGLPIIERPDWDAAISADFDNVYPHRALLTVPRNLVLGVDGTDEDMLIKEFYDEYHQENVVRAQYKIGTQYHHTQLIVAAY